MTILFDTSRILQGNRTLTSNVRQTSPMKSKISRIPRPFDRSESNAKNSWKPCCASVLAMEVSR